MNGLNFDACSQRQAINRWKILITKSVWIWLCIRFKIEIEIKQTGKKKLNIPSDFVYVRVHMCLFWFHARILMNEEKKKRISKNA